MNEVEVVIMQSALYRPESPIDRAKRYSWFIKQGFSVSKIADTLDEKMGKVYRYLRLLKLPVDVQKQVHEGRISMTAALRPLYIKISSGKITRATNKTPQQLWQESWVGAGPDNLISGKSLR